MTYFISFLTAIFGAIVGVYLKEVFSDIFSKKRRKKEAKSLLIKNIVKFFRFMKVHANNYNGATVHKFRLSLLQGMRGSQITPESRTALNNDIEGIFKYGRELSDKDERIYGVLVEIEAEIISIASECSYYLEKHQYSQLRKSLDEMFLSTQTENIRVRGYESLAYGDLVKFQNSVYEEKLIKINNTIDDNQKKYELAIKEIFSK